MNFKDLPVEILPEILQFIIKPQHLASACLVNHTFRSFGIPRLYERISIYSWHKGAKSKVVRLFETLSQCESLALFVCRLEIRDFPKTVNSLESDLLQHVLKGLENCTNLRACSWTRDGSLNSEIIEALHSCSNLQELEFNGHSEGNYDPRLFLRFTSVKQISVIMPSAALLSHLSPWFSLIEGRLQKLTLICKASSIVTDSLLISLAPQLINLDHFHLAGCPKVTHYGVWPIVSTNLRGLLGLGLEGISPRYDMNTFASQCKSRDTLKRLRDITLTVQQQVPLKKWIHGVLELLSQSPLELFQIYGIGASFESPATAELWEQLVATHGQRIVRFSVHRMLVSIEAIRSICITCINLEQLFVVVEPASMGELSKCLPFAKKLRTIHVNYPLEASNNDIRIIRPDEVLTIAGCCSSTLTQFGCNSKVWQIGRTIVSENGVLNTRVNLGRYENPDIPEQFLVVRT